MFLNLKCVLILSVGCQALSTAFSDKEQSADGENDVPNFEQLGSVRMPPQNQALLHSTLCLD